MNDDEDFPTVGLTPFDKWFVELWVVMVASGFIKLSDVLDIDREHWRHYYDSGYSPKDAFEEDLTCYGD